jgi:HK97 family phage major capsid protein
MAGSIDFSGIIPPSVAAEIIAVAAEESAVLSLGQRVPMPTGVTEMPVQTGLPVAGWVAQPGGRKPFTDLTVGMKTMKAEEVAAVVAIPQAYLDDSAINLWNFVRPQLGSAIARALDFAVLFGINAPASFPAGGLTSASYCQAATAGTDAAGTVNNAMGLVEQQGLAVTGHTADMLDQAVLRNIRDNTGAFLLGPNTAQSGGLQTLWGHPIVWDSWPYMGIDFITGYWLALQVGVRQDITYALSDQAVIADAAGNVVISAFQDNIVVMKAEARFGMLVTNPPTERFPGGALPFASTKLGTEAAATGATAGTPGAWTPPGSRAPADHAAMGGVTASPATAWNGGEYVITGDTNDTYWDGAAWQLGRATLVTTAKSGK